MACQPKLVKWPSGDGEGQEGREGEQDYLRTTHVFEVTAALWNSRNVQTGPQLTIRPFPFELQAHCSPPSPSHFAVERGPHR